MLVTDFEKLSELFNKIRRDFKVNKKYFDQNKQWVEASTSDNYTF